MRLLSCFFYRTQPLIYLIIIWIIILTIDIYKMSVKYSQNNNHGISFQAVSEGKLQIFQFTRLFTWVHSSFYSFLFLVLFSHRCWLIRLGSLIDLVLTSKLSWKTREDHWSLIRNRLQHHHHVRNMQKRREKKNLTFTFVTRNFAIN